MSTTGGPVTLTPEADTYLPGSTYQSMGQETQLYVGADARALVRFDLSSLGASADVTGATLRVYTTTQYDTIEVAAEAVATGGQGPPLALEVGIAGDYESDVGIGGDPDVVMFDDFEGDWQSRWTSTDGHFDVVDADPDHGFVPLQGHALRMTVSGRPRPAR